MQLVSGQKMNCTGENQALCYFLFAFPKTPSASFLLVSVKDSGQDGLNL